MKKLLLLLALVSLPAAASAQSSNVPVTISYSGKVVDAAGVPVGNTTAVNRMVWFRIWNHPSATAASNRLWSESQSVTITGGEFSVLVGQGTAVSGETNAYTNFADVFNNGGSTLYLGVTVDDGTSAADPELSPRQQIVTNPFAFRAKVAESVAAGAIGNTALANGAVGTSAQIADGAVTSPKIVSLDGAKIQAGTIPLTALTTAAAASLATVDGANIVTGTITSGKIKQNEIKGGTTGNLALATITKDNLATASVTSNEIADATIATIDLADSAVTLAKLASNSVDGSKIVDGSIVAADLATNSVTNAKIVAGSVDSTKILAGSVGLTQLDAVARAGLPKARAVYNQGVSATVTTKNAVFPIDLGDLGNDADGCRMMILQQNQGIPWSFQLNQVNWFLEQPGFAVDANFPQTIRGRVQHLSDSGIGSANFTLNPATLAIAYPENPIVQNNSTWVRIFTYYPGPANTGAPSPYNVDQEPNASNANAGGPAVIFNVVSVVTGTGKLTITLDNPHAIQVGDYVEINGMTGTGISEAMTASPRPNAVQTIGGVAYPPRNGAAGNLTGGLQVTAVPDRMSFEIALSGATGVYSGGTVKHQPVYNRFRVWAVVIAGISARIIVSDY